MRLGATLQSMSNAVDTLTCPTLPLYQSILVLFPGVFKEKEQADAAELVTLTIQTMDKAFPGRLEPFLAVKRRHLGTCQREPDVRMTHVLQPHPTEAKSIQAMFDDYMKVEFRCDLCPRSEWTLPHFLILFIQRADPETGAIRRTAADYYTVQTVTFGPHKYALVALIFHCGTTMDTGHYISAARYRIRCENKWFLYDDLKETTSISVPDFRGDVVALGYQRLHRLS